MASTGGYTVAVQSLHGGATSFWRNARVGGWLTASGVTASGATLTLSGHGGSWYVKQTAPTAGACSASAVTGTTHTLSTLSAGAPYTYTAYSDSSCATAIASASFSTGISVSNLSETSTGIGLSIESTFKDANAFTTGSHAAGYTLQAVVIKFRDSAGDPGTFSAAIHGVSGGQPGGRGPPTRSAAIPRRRPRATAPTPAPGTCSLDSDTTYFLRAFRYQPGPRSRSLQAGRYGLRHRDEHAQQRGLVDRKQGTKTKYLTNDWGDAPQPNSFMFELIATKNPTLSVSSVTSTAATLNIADYTGNWRYKADKAPHNACSAVQTGSSANLTGLTWGTTYVYKAYSAAGCADANLLATAAAFTTASESVSNMGETSRGINVGVLAADLEANAFTTGGTRRRLQAGQGGHQDAR